MQLYHKTVLHHKTISATKDASKGPSHTVAILTHTSFMHWKLFYNRVISVHLSSDTSEIVPFSHVNRNVDTGYDPLQGWGGRMGSFGPMREVDCPFWPISASFLEYFNAKIAQTPPPNIYVPACKCARTSTFKLIVPTQFERDEKEYTWCLCAHLYASKECCMY